MAKKSAPKTSAAVVASNDVPAWLDGASEAQLLLAKVSCIAGCYSRTAMLTFQLFTSAGPQRRRAQEGLPHCVQDWRQVLLAVGLRALSEVG